MLLDDGDNTTNLLTIRRLQPALCPGLLDHFLTGLRYTEEGDTEEDVHVDRRWVAEGDEAVFVGLVYG